MGRSNRRMRHDQYEPAGESPAVKSAIKGMIAAARKIVRWFEPRTIRANIILLILTFAVPLLITSMYFMVNGIDKDIAAARLEIHGNAYQRPLENLLDEIAVHERVMAGSATSVSGAEQRKQLELQIDSQWRALAFIQQQFGRELQFTNEGLKKRNRDHIEISMVEREWRSLRDARTLSAVDSASKHQHLVKDLRAMIEHSGDTSGLILDPDLDSYYLIDATLKALPQTQDRLAALSSRIRNWPSTVKLSPATRSQLAVVSGFLHESDQDRITGDIDTSLNEDDAFNGRSESLHVNLPPAVKRYVEANQSLAVVIQHALDSADAGSLDDIAAAADRTREASVGLWWVAEPELNRLLATRIFYRQKARTRGILLMGTAVLLPGFFAFLMIRSITRPIIQLSGIAVRISLDRDYSVRAPVCGKGETGALITAFNDMLSQIQVHKITEDKLRESEERYAIAAHGANDGLWDWKLDQRDLFFAALDPHARLFG
jgi:methyl-accepting chemotaxis protein